MREWAVKKDGTEVKRHSTRTACVVECLERGWAVRDSFDFVDDAFQSRISLIKGVEITEVDPSDD